MNKPTPNNKEVPFTFEEQFFSTTDNKGVIEFGNEVFVRISGYPTSKIIGAPHNIIRHPDMPKAVFKIFWQTLKAGSPIGAYVKNMASDGSYYWVFAFAFPVNDGYLSIRFKPSSDLFGIVKDLYVDVLKKEKATSMDEGEIFLLKCLKEKGFASYEDFMVHATVTELKSHEKHLSEVHVSEIDDHIINKITEIRGVTADQLNKSFSKIDHFEQSSTHFSQKINLLSDEFKKLKFLSMNMNILAANLGDAAATLSIISEEFARLASQIENQMATFTKFTESLLVVVKNCTLNLSALKAQMNMVDFFVKESIGNLSKTDNAFEGMLKNKDIFTGLFQLSVSRLSSELIRLKSELETIAGQILEIQKFINGLQIIKQTGSIESARNDDLRAAFNVYLSEMTNFISFLRDSILDLNSKREDLYKNAIEVQDSTHGIKNNISELFKLALMKSA
jgi:PAS domain S-box-containing protein